MGISLSKYQQAIIEAVKDTDNCLSIQAVAGCHGYGQGILMYDGSVKNVEDVVIGAGLREIRVLNSANANLAANLGNVLIRQVSIFLGH